MNDEEILKLTSKIGLMIWIKNIVASKEAEFSRRHKTIIELKQSATSLFAFGRRNENNTPIISVHESITPFIFSYRIQSVAIDKFGGVYLIYGKTVPAFSIKLCTTNKRTFVINEDNNNRSPLGSTIDLYSHHLHEDDKVSMSRILHRTDLLIVDNIDDIIPTDRVEALDYTALISEDFDEDFDLENPDNFDNFLDPL